MTDPITAAELAEWQALCDTATEGPWKCWDAFPLVQHPGEPFEVGITRIGPDSGYGFETSDHAPILATRADAEFVALARTVMPRLLAEREYWLGWKVDRDFWRTRAKEAEAAIARVRAPIGFWYIRPDGSIPACGVGSWTGPMPATLDEAREYAEGRPLRVIAVCEVDTRAASTDA